MSDTARRVVGGSADPEGVASWSAELPDSFIMCRDFGHTWRPFKARYNPEEQGYDRVLRCGRCRTERSQTISGAGLVLYGQYDYPDGYTAPAGTGRLDSEARGALRLESTLRLISKDER